MEADYVIVGGGTAGLVVAYRLKKKLPDASIIIVEAGGDNSTYEFAQSFSGLFPMQMSPYNWGFQANSGLADVNIMKAASGGKALGGSATINAGVWFRGPAADYDTWADISGDPAWRYENMVPFFKLAENLQDDETGNKEQHANDGYIKVWSARARLPRTQWPLREPQRAAWKEAGVEYVPDPNNGKPEGLGEQFDVWDRGHRQFGSKFLDLKGIQIVSGTFVERITFDMPEEDLPKATAIDLTDGQCIKARKEIIVSAGTYNSPKLLMLSGIGDEHALACHGIDCIYHNPNVGRNLFEHLSYTTVFKLKEPGALGAPAFAGTEYGEGFPADYSFHGQVDRVSEASKAGASAEEQKYLARPGSSNVQICLWYMQFAEVTTGVPMVNDGTVASAVTCLVSPTSRGSVSLKSGDPKDPPIVIQNFFATESDRFVMREGLRKASRVFVETEAGKSFVQEQLVPADFKPITAETADEDIDERVRRYAWSIQHPMGTCSMGTVLDSHCKVKGVEGLRVVDASVMPTPLGTNTQCAVYAIAERVAEWIGNGE
jgi:choline dehydrogenase-like flavoprotein